MISIALEPTDSADQSFNLYENGTKMGEMVVRIVPPMLTVYHTGVEDAAQGKGYAKMLLDEMVSYVREHNLKVHPLCIYVHRQFETHIALYKDIWLGHENA